VNKIAMITGASSGFGKACAETFAAHGFDLILTARRAERLEQLKQDLEKKFSTRVLVLVLDVRDRKAVFAAVDQLNPSWRGIDILVNNAGLALGRDYFDQASLDDWETMIDTNLKGLLFVSRAVLPLMEARGFGHVINIGSTAAKEVYEKGNVYCASKAAVDAVSKAMRIDLLSKRIKVTAIHPGAAETEFSMIRFKGDQSQAKKVYDGYSPLTAGDIAELVYYCTTLPAHVCVNELVVTCLAQANSFYLFKDPD
jgi:3-hydroxy acid dehydrogenase / malonic semialdehyde reductase